jgi:hypothetical protein
VDKHNPGRLIIDLSFYEMKKNIRKLLDKPYESVHKNNFSDWKEINNFMFSIDGINKN